jgi:DNA topoisomerase-1
MSPPYNAPMVKTTEIHRIYNKPELSAKEAGLAYLLDDTPGILRQKRGKGFIYKDVVGKAVRDEKELEWIDSLRIPPAWQDVWISPIKNAHLLATGRDERGRKQYIYHPKWNELRSLLKFYRLILFAEQLPKLRSLIRRDLRHHGLPRERVIAAVLSLMDKLSIRIGSEEYAKENQTYGLTTLEDRHASIWKDRVTLHFIGKSHKEREVKLEDPSIAHIVKKSKDVAGHRLFQYFDDTNNKHPLTSNEVNAYIQDVAGQDFTAKDFRTWAASAHAYELMKKEADLCSLDSAAQKIRDAKAREIIRAVAEKLGNTPAVCKSHYVHTDLQEIFSKGEFSHRIGGLPKLKPVKGLSAHEVELQYLLAVLYREKVASFLS